MSIFDKIFGKKKEYELTVIESASVLGGREEKIVNINTSVELSVINGIEYRELLFISYDKKVPPINRSAVFSINLDTAGHVYSEISERQIPDPSTIYVYLPITDEHEVQPLPYWPHYIELNSGQRYIYLNWLRNIDNQIDIGYVFLYYYGLERHLLVGDFDKAFSQIIRLRNVHKNKSFQKYSENALIHSCVMRNRVDKLFDLHEKTEISGFSNTQFLLAYNLKMDLLPNNLIDIFYKAFILSRKAIKENRQLLDECIKEVMIHKYGKESFSIKEYSINSTVIITETRFANYSFPVEIQKVDITDFYQCVELMTDLELIFKLSYKKYKEQKALVSIQKQFKLQEMNISEYINSLNNHYNSGITSEQFYYNNLQTLLKSYDTKLKIANDLVFVACGAPNYIISNNNSPIGFINAEDLGVDLKSKFFKNKVDRYIASINNVILTNYLDFYYYADGEYKASVSIAEVQNARLIPLPENFTKLISIIQDFNSYSGQIFKSINKLAGIAENWGISLENNDKIVNVYLRTIANTVVQKNSQNQRPNIDAFQMFIEMTKDTKALCDRIWKLEEGYCNELKIFLGIGILNGEGAQVIGRKIRQYLENPEALFRRTRDKDGNLVLDKSKKEDTPNKQNIKAAYEKVVMVMASITNQSYLLADHKRWLMLPMVIGFKISLSGQHIIGDICDDLAGIYPKTFVFTGWHLCCHCHAVAVMMPQQDFKAYLSGEKKLEPEQITKMPDNFIKYVEKNKEQIASMKDQPDWIKYNFENGDIRKGLKKTNY